MQKIAKFSFLLVFLMLAGIFFQGPNNFSYAQTSNCSLCGDGILNICDKTECEGLGNCAFSANSFLPGGQCLYKTPADEYAGQRAFNANFSVKITDNVGAAGVLNGQSLDFNILSLYYNSIYKTASCVITNNTCSFSVSLPDGPSFQLLLSKEADIGVFECSSGCAYPIGLYGQDRNFNVEVLRDKYRVSFFAGSCPNALETACSTSLTKPVEGANIKITKQSSQVANCSTGADGFCSVFLAKGAYSLEPSQAGGYFFQYSSLGTSPRVAYQFLIPETLSITLAFKKDLYPVNLSCHGYQVCRSYF